MRGDTLCVAAVVRVEPVGVRPFDGIGTERHDPRLRPPAVGTKATNVVRDF